MYVNMLPMVKRASAGGSAGGWERGQGGWRVAWRGALLHDAFALQLRFHLGDLRLYRVLQFCKIESKMDIYILHNR